MAPFLSRSVFFCHLFLSLLQILSLCDLLLNPLFSSELLFLYSGPYFVLRGAAVPGLSVWILLLRVCPQGIKSALLNFADGSL